MDTNEIDVNDISGLDLSKIYEQTVPKQFPGAFFNIDLSAETFNLLINILDSYIINLREEEYKDFVDNVRMVRESLLRSSYVYTASADNGEMIKQVHSTIWQDDIPVLISYLANLSDIQDRDYIEILEENQ